MPDILWGKGSYRRDNGDFANLELVNMFVEQTPTVEQGVSLMSRPGLAEYLERGDGPVKEVFYRSGLFSDALFTLSGDELYRDATLLGTINGSGPPSIASSNAEIVITQGQTAYSYNGTNLAAITFPDSANVTSVTFLNGRFVYARADTDNYYWSEVNDGRTITGAAFSAAESAPDSLLDTVAVGDNLFLLGHKSLEVHMSTTSTTLPYSRISQRSRNRGVVNTGCAIEFDNALHFIGDDFVVYRMAEVPMRISHHGLEERISQSTSWRLFSYLYQGHAFLAVRLDGGTWVFDPAAGPDWSELRTYGIDNFLGQCAINYAGQGPLFGSSVNGKIYRFSDPGDALAWTDAGLPLERRFTGAFPIKGGAVPVDSLEVTCNSGATVSTLSPVVEVRASRDGGHTFGTYRTASLGEQGQRRKRPRWRRLGNFDAPGAMFDFRVTDAVPLRVSAVLINEPVGGRSR